MDRSAGANRTSVLPPPEPTMLGIARSLRHSEATRAKHLFYYEDSFAPPKHRDCRGGGRVVDCNYEDGFGNTGRDFGRVEPQAG